MKTYLVITIYAILGIITIILFDGTGGGGDSIYHYLYAKEAPENINLYFDHWAKPLWVLVASPFAQLGFVGMKIMNLLAMIGTLLYTVRTAELLKLKDAWVSALLIMVAPLVYVLTFSGLTEPFFAFLLIFSTYLFLKNKVFWSVMLISFLPYVRSEGLFYIGIFGFMLIWTKQWKYLPVLILGSLVYGIAGYPVHGDLLWVFNKVPYAKLSSTYGDGTAFHFVDQLLYVIGIPFYVLFWIGMVGWLRKTFKSGFDANLTFIVYGGAVSFIVAHSIFWYFGIFNSMGLNRVLICIIPFLAIIGLIGINFITHDLLKRTIKLSIVIRYLLLTYLIIFPFTSNPAAINFKEDLSANTEQRTAQEAANYIKQHYSDYRIVTANIHFCQLLNKDCFDSNDKVFLNQHQLDNLKGNDIIIWENWFAIVEQGIGQARLDEHPQLQKVSSFERTTPDQRNVKYIVYEVINP